jgi:hypothetical protein
MIVCASMMRLPAENGGESLQSVELRPRRARLLAATLGATGAALFLTLLVLGAGHGTSSRSWRPDGMVQGFVHTHAWGVLTESGADHGTPGALPGLQQGGEAAGAALSRTEGTTALGLDGSSGMTWLAAAAPGNVPIKPVDWNPPEGIDYKVKLEVIVESQDPNCKVFTDWVLSQVVDSPGMLDIIDLKMTPWGFGRASNGDGTAPDVQADKTHYSVTFKNSQPPKFLCEHGPSECEGNALMACTQALYPKVQQWFRVNMCIQSRACAGNEAPTYDAIAHTGSHLQEPCRGTPSEVAPDCIDTFGDGMNATRIAQCVSGEEGANLLIQHMMRRATIQPPVEYVPWILVDDHVLNYPNRSNAYLLGRVICERYHAKVFHYYNASGEATPMPMGCFYFPTEVPVSLYHDSSGTVIVTLWVTGGVCFLVGVSILVFWKWRQQEYERLSAQGSGTWE